MSVIEHKKNTAYYLVFPMVDDTTPSSFKTGVSPADTAYYKDGAGAWTTLSITDTAAEIGSTGMYEIDLTAAEMNHDQVIVKFSVSGASDTAFVFDMRTELAEDLGNGSGQVSLLTATQASVDAIETDTNSLNDTKVPQTLNLTASGNIGIDWANVENPTTALDLSGTDIQLCDTVTTADTATDLTNLPTIPANWITAAGINADAITAAKIANGAIDAATFAAGAIDNTAIAASAITATEASVNVSQLSGSATAADNLEASALGIVTGACEGTPSTTVIQTDLAETTDDHYIGRVVVFTSGDAAGEATDITDYTGSSGTITVTALTTAPAALDTFVIV